MSCIEIDTCKHADEECTLCYECGLCCPSLNEKKLCPECATYGRCDELEEATEGGLET